MRTLLDCIEFGPLRRDGREGLRVLRVLDAFQRRCKMAQRAGESVADETEKTIEQRTSCTNRYADRRVNKIGAGTTNMEFFARDMN